MRVVLLLALLLSVSVCEAVHKEFKTTVSYASNFLDIICVATHWSYTDTPYGRNYTKLKQLLVDSGIKHVRDGMHERLHDLAQYGIRATVAVDPESDGSNATVTKNRIKAFNAIAGAIDTVEGPNEPDKFWAAYHPNGYMGQGFPAGAVAFLKDLYAAIKGDPATRNLTVMGISLGVTHTYNSPDIPLGNNGELNTSVDWGNFHPYPGGNPFNPQFNYSTIVNYYANSNFPSIALDEYPMNLNIYSKPYKPKPMSASETGYSTTRSTTSPRAAGKYIPRLFLEYFRLGLKRACIYEFVNEKDLPDDREANFGMVYYNLTAKPAYTATKNLIRILNNSVSTPRFAEGEISLNVTYFPPGNYTRTQFIHHIILQNNDGRVYIIFWHEISNCDTTSTPYRELFPPEYPINVRFINSTLTQGPFTSGIVHHFDDPGTTTTTPLTLITPTSAVLEFNLSVPDRAIIVELSSASSTTSTEENASSTQETSPQQNTAQSQDQDTTTLTPTTDGEGQKSSSEKTMTIFTLSLMLTLFTL